MNKSKHINPKDKGSTRIAIPCSGRGYHQTIAGALLKSPQWKEWCKHASENMLYDVDETAMIDAMSDGHFQAFIEFIKSSVIKK